MTIRSSGILLPIFSLPSRFGIGDFGPGAYGFADFLKQTGQQVWQILPLTPTAAAHHHSPYYCPSAFALNPLFISPEIMVEEGWLNQKDITRHTRLPNDRVVYHEVVRRKTRLFKKAYRAFNSRQQHLEFESFCHDQDDWLEDYACFTLLKSKYGNLAWNRWPGEICMRRETGLQRVARELAQDIGYVKFLQYTAFTQWHRLKAHCNAAGLHIFGDLPIYVPHDSADVWAHCHLFKLDRNNNPAKVSGVPPDYFSKTGQRWGHPVYRWPAHEETGFKWWMDRMTHNLSLFDLVRIDHFRGLVACWEIPAKDKTAVSGKWVRVPAHRFFGHLMRRFIQPPIIAEDLGLITPDVREILQQYELPGMRVLVFGFSGDLKDNPNTFHNIPTRSVAYTGTHDTNTVRGWFETELSQSDKKQLFSYLGRTVSKTEIAWELIRMALMSPAERVILPLQDILGLGKEARMNRPAGVRGNWQWRVSQTRLDAFPARRLAEAVQIYGRAY